MSGSLLNLIHVMRRYKVASFANILGLSAAFAAFMIVSLHVGNEYGFDSQIPGREYIFQMENLRNDGIWEANWARPQAERFIASSSQIEAAGLYNGISYLSFEFGFSKSSTPGAPVFIEKIERIRPGFLDVFGFDIISGSRENMTQFGNVLISESMAKRYYGDEDPIGKPIYFSEFNHFEKQDNDTQNVFDSHGLQISFDNIIGGVYRDFPTNTRLQNVAYSLIAEDEMMGDWSTGSYYCFVRLSSPQSAEETAALYMEENREFLRRYGIEDIRLRPLDGLYFNDPVRADSAPYGNKLATDMLMLIAVLIVIIALINYVNFSVVLAPVRIRSINTRKVLGCAQSTLRWQLISESLYISLLAFMIALAAIFLLQEGGFLAGLMGGTVHFSGHGVLVLWSALLAVSVGIIAGIYPAVYMTSFPPAMAINGSYSLTAKAKSTRKILVGFQYVTSIALIIGAIFISMQNRYVRQTELGFDKDKILEVRLSMSTAIVKNKLYRDLLVQHPDIEDVAFNQFKFLTDESQSMIGYFYRNEHYFMGWRGVSPNFPEVMGIEIIAGRDFRPGDQERTDDKAVTIINEAAAREIISRFPDEFTDVRQLLGTHINDAGRPVEIVGIARDFHFESLYRQIKPFGFWVSAPGQYRRTVAENFTYVKISPGDPAPAIAHIIKVVDEIDTGYPADVRFLDQTMESLYSKSRKQGLMVTLFTLLAIIISLVGVFGLVIFEAQRREKEIAVRKVFGADIRQILRMFNGEFLRIVAVCFVIAVPLAVYGINVWLRNFAYRTPLYIWVFIAALLCISVLTIVTVTFQSYRTATENPARKLHK